MEVVHVAAPPVAALQDAVDALQPRRVGVEGVQEDVVEEGPQHLGRRRIALHGGGGGLVDAPVVPGRDGEDPVGAQVYGGGEGGGLPDAPVPVVLVPDLLGREEDGQRRGGHHVVDGEVVADGAALGALPELHVGAALDEGHRPARLVRGGRDGGRPQAPLGDVLGDAGGVDDPLEEPAKGGRVHQAPGAGSETAAGGPEGPEPTGGGARHADRVGAEDVAGRQGQPVPGEALGGRAPGAGVGGQVGDVDGPGGDAGEDRETALGPAAPDVPQHPHLVRGSRATAREDEGRTAGVGRGQLGGLAAVSAGSSGSSEACQASRAGPSHRPSLSAPRLSTVRS